MTDEPLTPRLTAEDVRVLRALPACDEQPWPKVWTLGEALNVLDLPGLMLTLHGLHHLGYVSGNGAYGQRGRQRWARSPIGEDYLVALDAPESVPEQEEMA